MTDMLASTTASPLLPNFLAIWARTFSRMASSEAPEETRSTCPATAPMNAMPIMRVSSSGVGACFFATVKASTTRKLMFFSRMVRRAYDGRARQTSIASRSDWRMNVPPSIRPLRGLVWTNAWWSGEITTSTSSSSALVNSTGSGLKVM